MKQIIFPSVIAKSQTELNGECKRLKGIKEVHLDVVDGKFAPNHSLDFNFKLDKNFHYQAHLMLKAPELWIEKHLQKVELFIPHFEEIIYPSLYIEWMQRENKKVAFAILPETKVAKLKPYLGQIDYILILTVHPGFYGGKYLKNERNKINQIKEVNPKIKVIVDGGMNPETIKDAAKAGADFFVSGTYITKAEKPKEAIKILMGALGSVKK